MLFYDNRDNNDNGKNGRNGRCHEVTYNRDNKITVVNLFFSQAQGTISSTCQLNKNQLLNSSTFRKRST